MQIKIIQEAIRMFNGILDVTKKVMDASDPKKYASGVEELNKGVSDTYAEMRTIITNSKAFTDEQKVEKLAELAKQEAVAKEKCGEAIKGNRENVSQVAMDVVKGFLTCGLYFVSDITRKLKKAEKGDVIEISSQECEAKMLTTDETKCD